MKQTLGLNVKLGYGLGDFATNLMINLVNFSYLFFMTNLLGISPLNAGLIMMLSKIWDAITDPIMGTIVDRTRSRWGSKRPYILFGAIPLGLSFVMIFWNPGLSGSGIFIYAMIAYMLFNTALTVVNIPYASLTVSMTHDPVERSSLTGWRMALALVGTLIAAGGAPVLIGMLGNGFMAYLVVAIIFGAVAIVANVLVFVSSKEVYQEPAGFDIKTGLVAVFKNFNFLLLALGTFLILISVNMTAILAKYYFDYVLKMPDMVSVGLAILFGGAILFIPLFHLLSKSLSKRNAYLIAMIAFIIGLLLLFILPVGFVSTLISFGLIAAGVSGVYLMPWSAVADTVEYSEWKTGVRPEGAIYGVFFFVMKAAAATGAFVAGWGLQLFGYKEQVAGQVIVQSSQAINGIQTLISLIPMIFIVLGVIPLFFYGIDRAMHANMVAEIAKRKAK